MSEKETLGMTEVKETKELTAAEKAKKKKAKYNLAKVIVAICVVLCIVLTVFEMGFTYRVLGAAEVEGEDYSVAEYNWLYTTTVYNTYSSYYQAYGQLASYFFNPNSPLDEQTYSEDKTWADHMKETTDASLVEMTKLYNAGVEAGHTLSEEYKAAIETEWKALESTAKQYGYTANDYCEMTYGRGVNEKVFREMYEKYYFAMSYGTSYREGLAVTSSDIDAYYTENADSFDSVSYDYYFASSAAAEGEDAEAAKTAAKEKAEKILSGEDTETALTQQKYSTKGSINELYRDWLFDSARVAGDKEMFESEDGYYVVEFKEVLDLHYNTVDVRHILVSPAEADGEKAQETANAEALEKAEAYKAEYEANPTEENFIGLAKEYSADGNAEQGGLYEKVYKGQMVEEFENWCFDEARKPGDVEIVETTYGYHVMYFVGENTEFYTYAVDSSIRAERYNEYLDGLVKDVEVTALMGDRFTGKHFN